MQARTTTRLPEDNARVVWLFPPTTRSVGETVAQDVTPPHGSLDATVTSTMLVHWVEVARNSRCSVTKWLTSGTSNTGCVR